MATSKRSTCPLRGRAQPRRPARIQGEQSTVLVMPLSPAHRKLLTILCLGAHSDDIEFGCGGTILMSSECAPRQRIVRLFPFAGDKGIPSTVECSPWILAGRLGWALPRSGHVL